MGCLVDGGRARLISRHGRGWSDAFPTVVQAALQLPLSAAVLDGELAVVLPSGRTSFQALQHRTSLPADCMIVLFVFDLTYLNGQNVGRQPYEERKALLERLLSASPPNGVLRYTPDFSEDGPRVLAHACELGAEGIVSKRRGSPYTSGRSKDWLKCKCPRVEPFVIGGYTESGSGGGLGALLVGQHDAQGALHYAGSVGTGKGFTREFLRELRVQLAALAIPRSPFVGFSPQSMRSPWGRRAPARTCWVQPVVVIDVSYLERTDDDLLRHPSFQRFRPELKAQNVEHKPRSPGDT